MVAADRLTASRACSCQGNTVPRAFEPVLGPVRALVDLGRAAATLAGQLDDAATLDLASSPPRAWGCPGCPGTASPSPPPWPAAPPCRAPPPCGSAP